MAKSGSDSASLLRCAIVFLVESFHSTSRVDHLLLARKQRMTLRANFDVVVTKRRARFDDVATSTRNFGRFIIRVNAFLHNVLFVLSNSILVSYPRRSKNFMRIQAAPEIKRPSYMQIVHKRQLFSSYFPRAFLRRPSLLLARRSNERHEKPQKTWRNPQTMAFFGGGEASP